MVNHHFLMAISRYWHARSTDPLLPFQAPNIVCGGFLFDLKTTKSDECQFQKATDLIFLVFHNHSTYTWTNQHKGLPSASGHPVWSYIWGFHKNWPWTWSAISFFFNPKSRMHLTVPSTLCWPWEPIFRGKLSSTLAGSIIGEFWGMVLSQLSHQRYPLFIGYEIAGY